MAACPYLLTVRRQGRQAYLQPGKGTILVASSRVSGLVIVLTLPVNEEEGHRPYLSQSAYPAKGTTVGGRTDDPRRERTRDAPARHRARAGAGQRQRGVPRVGDLADAVLPLAQTPGTLRSRRRAPASPARPGGAPRGDRPGGGAAGTRDRDQRRHLGGADGSRPTWRGPGGCAWRPAPCSDCCAGSGWPRGARG